MAAPAIAILGWGSLLWDDRHEGAAEFDRWHGPWREDGPLLKLEFSRISTVSRPDALTLVIDPAHGSMCKAWYCLSRRTVPEDAFEDLRKREGIPPARDGRMPASIGRIVRRNSSLTVCRDPGSRRSIQAWADEKGMDAVTWTDLRSNFDDIKRRPFSISNAMDHIGGSAPKAREMTLAYVRRAPASVETALRKAVREHYPGGG